MDKQGTIRNVIRTLETVEVRGRENLDRMLGCILTLDKLAKEETTNADNHDGNGHDA